MIPRIVYNDVDRELHNYRHLAFAQLSMRNISRTAGVAIQIGEKTVFRASAKEGERLTNDR